MAGMNVDSQRIRTDFEIKRPQVDKPDSNSTNKNVLTFDSNVSDIEKKGMRFKDYERKPDPKSGGYYNDPKTVDNRINYTNDSHGAPSGLLKEENLINGQKVPAGTYVSILSNGWFMESKDRESAVLEINGTKYSAITFQYNDDKKSGHVQAGKLSEDQMIKGQLLPKGSVLSFDDKGSLKSIDANIKVVTTLATPKGQAIDFLPGWVEFDKNGKCKSGKLAEDTVANGVKYLKGTEIRFDGNLVESGTPAEPFKLSPNLTIKRNGNIRYASYGVVVKTYNFLPRADEPQHKYFVEVEFKGKKFITEAFTYYPSKDGKPEKISIEGRFLNSDGSKISRADGEGLKKLGVDFDDRLLDSK